MQTPAISLDEDIPTAMYLEDEEYLTCRTPSEVQAKRPRERPKLHYIYPHEQKVFQKRKPFMLPREPGQPDSAYPQVTKRARSCEVTGQCKKCLDMFTVSLYLSNGRLKVSETPRLKVVERGEYTIIYHRPLPDCCGGEVSLYGSAEQLINPHAAERCA